MEYILGEMDILDKKAEQLAELLGIDITDIEIEYYDGDESRAEFRTPDGTYMVMTEDEAFYDMQNHIDNDYLDETEDFYVFRQSDTDDRSISLHNNTQHDRAI